MNDHQIVRPHALNGDFDLKAIHPQPDRAQLLAKEIGNALFGTIFGFGHLVEAHQI